MMKYMMSFAIDRVDHRPHTASHSTGHAVSILVPGAFSLRKWINTRLEKMKYNNLKALTFDKVFISLLHREQSYCLP